MRPLDGVKVLDLSRVFAGPVAGRTLADLGAEVVKVEPPDGDVTRNWGRKTKEISTYYAQQNCGKQNVCIDLNSPGGPDLVAELASKADIVIENFRPGVLARFALDWPALSAEHPELIMLSISGFGQGGPESQRAAYASIIHAEAGVVDQRPGVHPTDLAVSAADVLSGMHGVIAVMAALRVRDSTGVGQYIDLAMIDAMTFSSDIIIHALDDTPSVERINGEVWQTADGPKMLTGGLRWIWHSMSTVHGLTDPTPKDAAIEVKVASRTKIIVDHLCALPDRAAVIGALDAANLAWADLRDGAAVLESPTIVHRKSVVQVDDRAGGTRPIIRSPHRMSVTDTSDPGVPSHRGEHNRSVLADWLDASPERIDQLLADDIMLADDFATELDRGPLDS